MKNLFILIIVLFVLTSSNVKSNHKFWIVSTTFKIRDHMFDDVTRIVDAPTEASARKKFLAECRKDPSLKNASMSTCCGVDLNLFSCVEILSEDIIK